MPLRNAGTDTEYFLVTHDEVGRERAEPDGSLLSESVLKRLTATTDRVTDLFLMSHGWKGDIPAAIEQYDNWSAAMAGVASDRALARQKRPGFRPLAVGMHWPSQPWGEESIDAGSGVLSAGDDVESGVETFARRIADTTTARSAIRTILKAARDQKDSTQLSPAVVHAYETLFAESGLTTGDASNRPGADQAAFDPAEVISEFASSPDAGDAPQVLGLGDRIKDAFLSPLRQLSFWKMKDRARVFGESGAHDFLIRAQTAAPALRIHFMGHSFGCIVASAAVAGAQNGKPLPRAIDSLFLVQGALSLWAYALDIPYAKGTAGYFNRILTNKLVRGPIVTTRSKFDTAVGRFYPLGARAKGQLILDDEFPEYGGIGTFGIQGADGASDLAMKPTTFDYAFVGKRIYNLEASGIIKAGEGASGAHSDIAHPEVAHAFWSAVLSESGAEPTTPGLLGGESSGSASRGGPSRGPKAKPPRDGLGWGRAADDTVMLEHSDVTVLGPPPKAAAPVAAEPPPAALPPVEQRWINAEIEGFEASVALQTNQWYVLAFDADVEERVQAVSSTPLDGSIFSDRESEITLTVQLDTGDFETSDASRTFRLGRRGKSLTKARFDIRPLHEGPSRLKATILKQGNFIQQIEITFDVGAKQPAPVASTSRGRSISAADVVQPRDLGFSMSQVAGGYECIVWGAVSARAKIPLQPAELAAAIGALRDEVLKVVMYRDAVGAYPYQKAIDIAEVDREFALKTLARAGALLFQKLFFGPAAAADSKKIGEFLRDTILRDGEKLTLQILADGTSIPWGLLYVGDASAKAQLSWDKFIGMRHVIEQIPLQNDLSVPDTSIRSNDPRLSVSLNLNDTIDTQMRATFVADQVAFWNKLAKSRQRLLLKNRTRRNELTDALADARTDDQIVYFYCHAESAGLADAGGPDASQLILSDMPVSLADLNLDAPTSTHLAGKPLIFINACESAQMSSAFYDGFVPYFMAKGARGVVGTECNTPALFATEWAARFFERFLEGEPLGEVFLGLRREFLEQHGNPLGLIYAVHCDGDTRVQPALSS